MFLLQRQKHCSLWVQQGNDKNASQQLEAKANKMRGAGTHARASHDAHVYLLHLPAARVGRRAQCCLLRKPMRPAAVGGGGSLQVAGIKVSHLERWVTMDY